MNVLLEKIEIEISLMNSSRTKYNIILVIK